MTHTDSNIDRWVLRVAGGMVLLSLILSQLHSGYWLWLTAFVGANLLQRAIEGRFAGDRGAFGDNGAQRCGLIGSSGCGDRRTGQQGQCDQQRAKTHDGRHGSLSMRWVAVRAQSV